MRRRPKKTMRKEYDFSKARRNPYARRLKKQITIRLDEPTIDYFKGAADASGPWDIWDRESDGIGEAGSPAESPVGPNAAGVSGGVWAIS